LRVQDAGGYAEVGGNVRFGLDVDVLCAVEVGWAAGTDAVGTEGADGSFFEGFVGGEVVEVVRGEVCDDAAIG
jgi:hypothetical protein